MAALRSAVRWVGIVNDRPSRPSPDLRPTASWVVDVGGILTLDARNGDAHWLRGTEAAVWSWLSAGHSPQELAPLLAAYLAIDRGEAERTLGAILRSFDEAGLTERNEPARG